ncbi:hypothetical protein KI809_18375 [Geobacter pelophilus]|uniref:Uncharacterized protein n=1 Tax=Geoanaerobacter pelophilus TaxID=60036 RepID=A0AAW4LGJ9_9BACT|nr:hypothetical protein [Geoanaerobacter pelophilus]MBT0666281.1 hypothetical protein [Geoanaerobacter pelophilus]
MYQTPNTPAACTTCERHHIKHQELFGLLTPVQQSNLEIALCIDCDVVIEWEAVG